MQPSESFTRFGDLGSYSMRRSDGQTGWIVYHRIGVGARPTEETADSIQTIAYDDYHAAEAEAERYMRWIISS